MAKVYLQRLCKLIERASLGSFNHIKLECKHFFSGAALYADERICLSLTPLGLALKLPEKTRVRLCKNGMTLPLRYFPKGPLKKDYVLFPESLEIKEEMLYPYMAESIRYVLKLPKPKK